VLYLLFVFSFSLDLPPEEIICNTRKFHHNKILLATWLSFIF
jgi:hypothetical protein